MQDGKTALILASSSSNLSVVNVLLKAKAKVDLPEKVISQGLAIHKTNQ